MLFPSNEQLHNVALAIDLMRDSGMKFYAKPEGKEIIATMVQLSHTYMHSRWKYIAIVRLILLLRNNIFSDQHVCQGSEKVREKNFKVKKC